MLLRRFLVLAALMFWQGGFTFYAAIVVPIGTEVLGSKAEQGRITRLVAFDINVTGAIALAVLAWDVIVTHSLSTLRWGRWLTWFVMAVALGALFVLYGRLDSLFNPDDLTIADRPTFRTLHRAYLWVSTVQWGCAVLFTMATLAAWRLADRTNGAKAITVPPRNHSG